MIGYNAFTYTKGLREEITFKVAPAVHRTHLGLHWLSAADGNLVVHKVSNRIQNS